LVGLASNFIVGDEVIRLDAEKPQQKIYIFGETINIFAPSKTQSSYVIYDKSDKNGQICFLQTKTLK